MPDVAAVPAEAQTSLIVSKTFEVVGASVVGPGHRSSDQPCQDVFSIETGDDWIVAVVSDGAGSASRGRDGARIVSQELCGTLAKLLVQTARRDAAVEHAPPGIEQSLVEGIERARERCRLEARDGEHLRSFHATVVGVVLLEMYGLLFHIGDGGASAQRRTLAGVETVGFSEPENGEYINQTFFFTEDHWRQHLRLTEIRGGVDAIWLMTDGAYDLVVPHGERCIRAITESEINRLVFEGESPDKGGVLAAILSSEQATRRNDDDKTLVIVRRKTE